MLLCISPQIHIQGCHVGSSKLATMEVFKCWKMLQIKTVPTSKLAVKHLTAHTNCSSASPSLQFSFLHVITIADPKGVLQ